MVLFINPLTGHEINSSGKTAYKLFQLYSNKEIKFTNKVLMILKNEFARKKMSGGVGEFDELDKIIELPPDIMGLLKTKIIESTESAELSLEDLINASSSVKIFSDLFNSIEFNKKVVQQFIDKTNRIINEVQHNNHAKVQPFVDFVNDKTHENFQAWQLKMATLTEYGNITHITNEEITLYRNIYMLMTIHKNIYTDFIVNSFRMKNNSRKYMYKNEYYKEYISYIDRIDEAYDKYKYHKCVVDSICSPLLQNLENLKNEIKLSFINLMMDKKGIPVNILKEINMQYGILPEDS